MRDEDEIIRADEEEWTERRPERTTRGFWIVVGALSLSCVLVLVLIAVNRPLGDSIAHAESTLRDAQAAAQTIHDRSGSYADADATALATADPSNAYRGAAAVSTGLDDVSIATAPGEWAAAVQARPEACFYLRLLDDGRVFYGAGTLCTGETALAATDPRW
jgi:type II secretory pathway component PulM